MERRVFHYTASSNNASYATSRERGVAGTFHSDLVLPPAVLEAALSHVLKVGGSLTSLRSDSAAETPSGPDRLAGGVPRRPAPLRLRRSHQASHTR
eukprot:scaffold99757_cov75-Phaeocystis_antarctica.AAC.5